MSNASRLLLLATALTVVALTIASLALVRIVPGWGVLFFYVLPTLFFALWTARELRPSAWRRTTAPLRWRLRQSRLAPPTRMRPEPVRAEQAFELAASGWLLFLRGPLRALRSRRARRGLEIVFALAAAAMAALVTRRLVDKGWPLHHASPRLIAAAVAFFLATFALRALAWQRLFRSYERPRSLALVASNATAAVAAIALPSRVDDAIAIGVLRRIGRRAPSVGTLALSLFLLGLLDMAALTPFAAWAAVAISASAAVHAGMLAIAGIGVGAAVVALTLPSLHGSGRVARYRLGRWLSSHAPASYLETLWSTLLVAASWITRAAGLYVLLDAVGLHSPFAVATAYTVAGAGAAALPVGPAGAATQAGVGAAVLSGAGLDGDTAIALAIAAQALTVAAAAVLSVFGIAVTTHGRKRAA